MSVGITPVTLSGICNHAPPFDLTASALHPRLHPNRRAQKATDWYLVCRKPVTSSTTLSVESSDQAFLATFLSHMAI